MNVASIHESDSSRQGANNEDDMHQVSLVEKDNDIFSFRKTFASENYGGTDGEGS
jgi:hypothetical protein